MMRSMVGSFARLRKRVTRSSAPFSSKEVRARLHVHAHRREDDRDSSSVGRRPLGALLDEARLPADLRGDLVVREAGGREERIFWPRATEFMQSIVEIPSIISGVGARLRVDRPVDVEELLRQHGGPLVDRLARAVEDAAEHVLETGLVRMFPENSTVVFWLSMPDVPSNTCTTASSPAPRGSGPCASSRCSA